VQQRVSLDDVENVDAINLLSVRQLKELLVNSFVDYKGCCERGELVEHVQRLWTEHQRNKKLGNYVMFLALNWMVLLVCAFLLPDVQPLGKSVDINGSHIN
jgi:hypothetical protein